MTLTRPGIQKANGKAPAAAPAYPEGFKRFWAVYPQKRRNAKAACLRAWRDKGLEAIAERVVGHVQALKGTETWRDGYEPAPLTYLRQERFHDDLPPPARARETQDAAQAAAEFGRGAV